MASQRRHSRVRLWGVALGILLALALAGCGASSLSSAGSAGSTSVHSFAPASGGTSNGQAAGLASGVNGKTGSPSSPASASGSTSSGASYLIKALDVQLAVLDPRQSAAALAAWLTATDAQATSSGTTYQQQDDHTYQVTLVYNVQATLYPQIEQYLIGYADQHGGRLIALHESVNDVTNQYVDTQSRLSNLKGEQQRLQDIMSKAQTLGDVITVEDRLTTVEGEIESIEAQLKTLTAQTTFYRVQIDLSPLSALVTNPVAQAGPWNPAAALQSALQTALVVGEALGTGLIWLAVFSIFLLPIGAIILIIRRVRRRTHPTGTATA